jgi:hypothetical protein
MKATNLKYKKPEKKKKMKNYKIDFPKKNK